MPPRTPGHPSRRSRLCLSHQFNLYASRLSLESKTGTGGLTFANLADAGQQIDWKTLHSIRAHLGTVTERAQQFSLSPTSTCVRQSQASL